MLPVQIGAALMHGLVGKCLEYLSGIQHVLSELGENGVDILGGTAAGERLFDGCQQFKLSLCEVGRCAFLLP